VAAPATTHWSTTLHNRRVTCCLKCDYVCNPEEMV
jgi:hypothetical protein